MLRLALILAALPVIAHADETSMRVWPNATEASLPSIIEMGEPTEPGAVATIRFQNERVHSGSTEFPLTYDGVTVSVEFGWNVNPDGDESVTVTPPEGYYAEPETITVPEYRFDEVHIYRVWLGG